MSEEKNEFQIPSEMVSEPEDGIYRIGISARDTNYGSAFIDREVLVPEKYLAEDNESNMMTLTADKNHDAFYVLSHPDRNITQELAPVRVDDIKEQLDYNVSMVKKALAYEGKIVASRQPVPEGLKKGDELYVRVFEDEPFFAGGYNVEVVKVTDVPENAKTLEDVMVQCGDDTVSFSEYKQKRMDAEDWHTYIEDPSGYADNRTGEYHVIEGNNQEAIDECRRCGEDFIANVKQSDWKKFAEATSEKSAEHTDGRDFGLQAGDVIVVRTFAGNIGRSYDIEKAELLPVKEAGTDGVTFVNDGKDLFISNDDLNGHNHKLVSDAYNKTDFIVGAYRGGQYHEFGNDLYDRMTEDVLADLKREDRQAKALSELQPGDRIIFGVDRMFDNDVSMRHVDEFTVTEIPKSAAGLDDVRGRLNGTDYEGSLYKAGAYEQRKGFSDTAHGIGADVGDPSGYIRAEDNTYVPVEENDFSDDCRKYVDEYVNSAAKETETVKNTVEESKASAWTKLYVPENRLQTRHPKDNPEEAFDTVEIPLGRQKVESFTVAHKGEKEFDGKGDQNKDILVTVRSDRPRNVTVYDRKTGERTKEQKMPEELVSDLKAYKSYQKSADAKHKELAAELSEDVKVSEASVEDQME